MATTINELMTGVIKTAFAPGKAAGVDTVVQFKFTGSQASDWRVIIKDHKSESIRGTHLSSKMTMIVDSDHYINTASLPATEIPSRPKIE